MPAGITDSDSMFSVRVTPWHGLGAVLDRPPASVAEAIEASGLGWSVAKEPIAVDRGDTGPLTGRSLAVRRSPVTTRPSARTPARCSGSSVSATASCRTTRRSRSFTSCSAAAIHFETAGSLHGGRRVWVLATLPDHVEVGGDPVRPYVLLMNSHDGSTAVIAATTPIRVVCQNTLNWGLSERQAEVLDTLRRSRDATRPRGTPSAGPLDRITTSSSSATATSWPRSAAPSASFDRCSISSTRTASGTRRAAARAARASRGRTGSPSCSCGGDTQGNAPGSKWAAVNVIIEYGDWLRPLRSTPQRFARALDDGPEKTRALQMVAAA